MVGLIANEFTIGEHPPVNGECAVVNAGALCADPGARPSVTESEREVVEKGLFFQKMLNNANFCLIHN